MTPAAAILDYPPGTLAKGVLFGGDGHLFLADGGHNILDFVLGKRTVSPISIKIFVANIVSRRKFLLARGIPYLHVLFPDKQTVLSDVFPYSPIMCLGDEYLGRNLALADLVIYPKDVLKTTSGDVFQRTDTHLTDLGTATVAHAIINRVFGCSHVELFQSISAAVLTPQKWVGDLGRRFDPEISEIRLIHKPESKPKRLHNNLSGANNGIVDLLFNTRAHYKKRLLIFGDSFGRDLAHQLSLYIEEVAFLRTPFLHPEIVEQYRPDIVLTENVERYLSACSSDDFRPAFMMYPHLGKGVYSPSVEFAEAFSAVLSYPRAPYQKLRAALGLGLSEGGG